MGKKQPTKPIKRAPSRKSISPADDLTKTADVELSEEELGRVGGGMGHKVKIDF